MNQRSVGALLHPANNLTAMTKISLIAKLTISEGRNADFEAALAQLVSTASEEDGLEVYAAQRDANDPTVYYFYELYTDQAALDVHGKSDAMKHAMAALGPLLDGRPEITKMVPVAAKGLAF